MQTKHNQNPDGFPPGFFYCPGAHIHLISDQKIIIIAYDIVITEEKSVKKFIYIILAIALTLGSLSGCGTAAQPADSSPETDSISIVATVFPAYDWTENILGDNPAGAEVTLLAGNGTDLHSYQPTAEDIMKISTCDLFIYVGGESDKWVDDALKNAVNEDMTVISMMEVLADALKEEELIEGMQDADEDSDEAADEPEYDEHVWLSLRNAVACVKSLSQAVQEIDKPNAAIYKANAEAYISQLEELNERYEQAVDAGSRKVILFGDRFPFRYMAEDYGLDYYAAFAGCSAETEASFETITFLSRKVDALKLPVVLTIEGGDQRIAETIVKNTRTHNQQILTMDSLQTTTAADIEGGATYLKSMENNLIVLKEALR
jgi:zinc transport system substrate-binding protein